MSFLIYIFSKSQLYFVNENVSLKYNQKILQIIENYKKNILIDKLNNGYSFVKEKFSENDIVNDTLSLYSDLLKSNNDSYLTKKNKKSHFGWLNKFLKFI